jgi:hypothetical protein
VTRDLTDRPEVAWATTTQPLDAVKTARNALLAKRGYEAPIASSTGTLALGRRATVPLDFKGLGGTCARIDVVAGAPLALVEARVWDDAGALVASGEASSSLALFACARGSARLELETRGSPGPFAVMVRPERWKDVVFAAHPLAASRMLERAAVGPDMLFEGKQAATRAQSLDAARVVSWSETIGPGRCMRVSVGAQGDGLGVELRALDGAVGEEIDRSEAAHAASVHACAAAEAARTVRFEARAGAGRMDAVIGERSTGKD